MENVFDLFREMNLSDEQNKTHNLIVSPYFLSMQKTSKGGEVKMGIPDEVVNDIVANDSRMFVLLCIDKKEYEKLNSK